MQDITQYFTMLGDGRAVLIGEHLTKKMNDNMTNLRIGKTAFSRNGDGRALSDQC